MAIVVKPYTKHHYRNKKKKKTRMWQERNEICVGQHKWPFGGNQTLTETLDDRERREIQIMKTERTQKKNY